ncbi:MAG: hypothetical protein HYX34_04260 [Actinobacteria bacterium]|nr:hypothetical protein [Actinomycetota bacterium]
MTRHTLRIVAFAAVAALWAAGCGGKDDGAATRSCGAASQAASGAKSGSGASSGSSGGSSACPQTTGSSAAQPACQPVGGPVKAAERTVDVALTEWAISPSPATVATGKVGFRLTNVGKMAHELVVVKGAPASQPRTADGALDEAKLAKGAIAGEVEGFPAGKTCSGVFTLAPGTYTLLCNLTDTMNGTRMVHLAKGMVAGFEVRAT